MEFVEALLDKTYYSLSVFLPVMIFAFRAERRPHLAVRLIASFLALTLLSYLPSLLLLVFKRDAFVTSNIDVAITFFFNLVYCILIVLICFRLNFLSAVYCSISGYCIQHIWGRLIDYGIFQFLPHGFEWTILRYFLALLLLCGICLAVYWFFVRKMYPTEGDFAENKTGQIILAVIVIGLNNFYGAYILEGLVSLIQGTPENVAAIGNQVLVFFNVTSAMVAFLTLLILFGMYHSKTISQEKAELDRMILEQKKKFESERTNINLINIKCHDLKHQLASLQGKMSKEEIKETVQALNIYDSTIHTGNEAIDIVLASKQATLKNNAISLSCLLDGSQLAYIPAYEIYSIFGNAIDNAIEGVLPLPVEKRRIHITQEQRGNFFCVQIKNYFDGKIDFEDGLPKTRKEDELYHGYGVKSMKLIMDKYHGSLTFSAKDDVFYLTLLFLLPEQK